MANLTITVDAELLKRARIKGLERGESVNAYLARKLAEYAGTSDQRAALDEVAAIAERFSGDSSGPWTRDEIHDR